MEQRRAAIYLRVSTDRQTVETQRPDVERVVVDRGLDVVHTYEEHESAVRRRPAFDTMLADARRRAFDVLVVWALDRFGRAAVENLLAVRDLAAAGVTVVSAREPWLDTSGPFREPMLFLVSWLGEQERARLIERTRAGMQRAAEYGTRSGRPIGRPHRVVGAELEQILALRAEGRSARDIAVALKIPRSTVRRALGQKGGSEGRSKSSKKTPPQPRSR